MLGKTFSWSKIQRLLTKDHSDVHFAKRRKKFLKLNMDQNRLRWSIRLTSCRFTACAMCDYHNQGCLPFKRGQSCVPVYFNRLPWYQSEHTRELCEFQLFLLCRKCGKTAFCIFLNLIKEFRSDALTHLCEFVNANKIRCLAASLFNSSRPKMLYLTE